MGKILCFLGVVVGFKLNPNFGYAVTVGDFPVESSTGTFPGNTLRSPITYGRKALEVLSLDSWKIVLVFSAPKEQVWASQENGIQRCQAQDFCKRRVGPNQKGAAARDVRAKITRRIHGREHVRGVLVLYLLLWSARRKRKTEQSK